MSGCARNSADGPPTERAAQGRLRMLNAPRVRSLEERHASIERRIAEEDGRPMPDAGELARLKREKLRVKDELEKLRRDERA